MRFLDDLPAPAWVGLATASLRTLLDWDHDAGIWHNLRHVVLLYGASLGVSYLAFMAMETPNVAMTSRDTVITAVITFFGINIVNSLKTLGKDLEKNPLQFITNIIAVWRTGKAAMAEKDKESK